MSGSIKISQEKSQATTLAELRLALANHFRNHTRFSPSLRSVLAYACLSDRPPRTLKPLAAAARVSRSTLWRHCRDACNDSPWRLPDVLNLIALMRDLEKHFAGESGRVRSDGVIRARAIKVFGVYPVDESEAVKLAFLWLREHELW
jgi:hypothetical protein